MPEVPKTYDPQSVEEKWYQFWLDHGCFTAQPHSPKPPFSIVIPPPNVTGMLHMGHVLNNTIQDILSRKARMDGKEVLWLPGTDHAGIATQVQVEKALKKEEGKSRHDIGREEFLRRVWSWKEKHGGIIIQQLKRLGASCDWTRERFTMDPEYSLCVQKVFVALYRKGLIYRGKRMVNWCPVSLTALSDEEVDMEPQKGFLYHFQVEVAERPGTFLTIATTRPETIPGDSAIAVNPKDTRYASLVGLHVLRPLPAELPREKKLIPIVADEHVDFAFGTGVLKVTPAHDKADFEIGQRHRLEFVDIMTPDAKMNARAGADLQGLDRFQARKIAVEKLRELGSLLKEEPYENKVGFSQRARVPIEPRLSEQWFLQYPSVAASHSCVTSGALKFYPDRWAKVYDHWMGNLQDWCISRQLWWGHRIPIWNKSVAAERPADLGFPAAETAVAATLRTAAAPAALVGQSFTVEKSGADGANEFFARYRWTEEGRLEIEVATECTTLVTQLESAGFAQDPDVLDTWFSSWLWPFATMGWPSKTETLQRFYPTTDLVTGPDIIFFWVARMIMAGYEFMGDLPFRNVYFTGIIRDKQGRKMSKSLGNSPDPLDLIGKYGADALRFGTMRSAPLGQDVLFDEKDVELGRNFCTKLWNACRFRQMQAGEVQGEINADRLRSDDKWILLKLDQAIREITAGLVEYKFNESTQAIYRFFWTEYCDWYLETTKPVFQGSDPIQQANTLAVMDFVLSHLLRLLHPFLPFITEELWHGMGYNADMPQDQGGETLMNARWPKPFDTDFRDAYSLDDCYLDFVNQKIELVTAGRNLRKESRLAPNLKLKFIFKPESPLPPNDVAVVKTLLNAEPFEIDPEYVPKKGTPSARPSLGDLFLPLDGLVDEGAERERLGKEREKILSEIAKVVQKLENPNFAQKVPPAVLAEHQQRLADWKAKLAQVDAALEALGT